MRSYANCQIWDELALEVKQTITRIVQFPDAWQTLSARTRRYRTKRFPYGIVYQVRNDPILIVAIMHMSRHPDTWKSRLHRDHILPLTEPQRR